ncbi:MAG TPA: glycosyltransferase family 87 protein [Candidatus Binatia bacterium]
MSAAVRDDHAAAAGSRRTALLLALIVFAIAFGAVSLRTYRNAIVPGQPELERYGLRDFRDAVHYPARALLDGVNPYRPSTYRARYPVGSKFPLYTPLTLLVHLPFGMGSVLAAGTVHYLLNVLCMVLLAYLSLRVCGARHDAAAVLGLGAFILVCRPGYTNVYTGECTAYVTLGAYLVLAFAEDRPVVGALGAALAWVKPTFGAPLTILLLARRDWRNAALRGILLGAIVSLPVLLVLLRAEGGVGPLLGSVVENYTTRNTGETYSGASVLALDAGAFVARLLGRTPGAALGGVELAVTLLILGFGVGAVLCAGEDRASRFTAITIACLTVLLAVHHQSYDAILVILPATALATGRWSPRLPLLGAATPWMLCALLLVPFVNYAASYAFVDRWHLTGWSWLAATNANGGALLCALVLTGALAFGAGAETR